MVTSANPNLYLVLRNAAKSPDNSQYGRDYARHVLNGLNATFRKFRVQRQQQEIIAEAILRWRILKDAKMLKADDAATERLFVIDKFLTEWLRARGKSMVVI